MSGDLLELIPEFGEIGDEQLRRQALEVWAEALALGGWTTADLVSMPYTLLVDSVEVSFAEHVSVVCRLCMAMDSVLRAAYGDRYTADRDTLIAGALLADVGKLLEFKRESGNFVWSETYRFLRHPFTGVSLCFKHGLPEAVMHIVATHSWEGDRFQRQAESIVFHHADFTDFDLSQLAAAGQRG